MTTTATTAALDAFAAELDLLPGVAAPGRHTALTRAIKAGRSAHLDDAAILDAILDAAPGLDPDLPRSLLGLAVATVRETPPRGWARGSIAATTRVQMIEARRQGEPIARIARRHNVAWRTVHRVLEAAGPRAEPLAPPVDRRLHPQRTADDVILKAQRLFADGATTAEVARACAISGKVASKIRTGRLVPIAEPATPEAIERSALAHIARDLGCTIEGISARIHALLTAERQLRALRATLREALDTTF